MIEHALDGSLTFKTVMAKRVELLKLIDKVDVEKRFTLSLFNVLHADSAGLALMLEILRYAKRQGVTLTFTHVPKQLMALAEFCRIKKVLNLTK